MFLDVGIYSATGHFVWLVRSPEQSTTGHSFGTYIINVRLRNDLYCVGWGVKLYSLTLSTFKNMLKTHLFSRSYFTDYEYEQRTLYSALVVTLAMLLHLINCRIIIIIIIRMSVSSFSGSR